MGAAAALPGSADPMLDTQPGGRNPGGEPATPAMGGGEGGVPVVGAAAAAFFLPHIRGPTCGSGLPPTSFSLLHFPR